MKQEIKYNTTASFDVDCEKGFTPLCPNELPVVDGHTIVDALNKQAKVARFRVGSKDVHPPTAKWIADKSHPQLTPIVGKNMDLRWNAHCISGTQGSELLYGLPHPGDYNFFVYKGIEPDMHPYGACFHDLVKSQSTGVLEWLLYNEIETIIVGGLALDFCVLETIRELLSHDFEVILNLSATKSLGKFHDVVKAIKKEFEEEQFFTIINSVDDLLIFD